MNKNNNLFLLPQVFSYEQYAIAVNENNSDLRDEINFALMEAMRLGDYDRIYNKWFSRKNGYYIPIIEKIGTGLLFQAYFHY